MESKRQLKFAKQIQKELAEIFQKDTPHFFKGHLVTLSGVLMSPDLGLAKVYISVFPFAKSEEVLINLNELKSEIRKLLGHKMAKIVRIIPELAFFIDDTEEKASHMDRLLRSLNIPPAPAEEP